MASAKYVPLEQTTGELVTLHTCIPDVTISNLDWVIGHPGKVFDDNRFSSRL
jgi:hypothetical protein